MYLKHKDFVIRSAVASDAAQLAAWWNDGRVMAHAGFPHGLGTTAEEVAANISTDTDMTQRRLIIERAGVPIGEMSYRNVGEQTAEIGIKICDFSQQEKGYGKQLLTMLISALFEELGFQKIVLDTNLKNKRAQHVYETLGFQKLRVNENAWTDQAGELQSSVDYEMRPQDFVRFE